MRNKITWKFALMQTLYWSSVCVVYAFSEHLLKSVGFRTDQIGIILAATHIASLLLQPILASVADRTTGPSLRAILCGAVAGIILFSLGMLFTESLPILFAVLFAVLSALSLAIQPLLNAVGFLYINRGEPLDYSFGRGIASIGYAVFVYLFGRLADFGNHVLVLAFLAFHVLLLAFLFYFVPKRQSTNTAEDKAKAPRTLGAVLKEHPHFVLLLLGTLFLFVSHNFLNSYMLSIMNAIGGGTKEMSNAISIAACLEVPTMLLFGLLLKRCSVRKLLRFSVVAFALKMFLTWFVVYRHASVPYLYVVQTLQLFAYALFVPASSYYANTVLGEADSAKAQMLVTAGISCGCVTSLLLGGFGIEHLGVGTSLLLCAISAVLGMILIFISTGWYQRKQRKGQNSNDED